MADYVPALKARMGDWNYYVTVMKLGKIAKECQLAEEIHANRDLDDMIQREISSRVRKEMVPYLLQESQRFYGALVVAVYGGEPDFQPVKVDEHELLNDRDGEAGYGFGLLRFDGSQVYYALDGQHRLKSIQLAVQEKPELRQEEITVIILKHEIDKEGLQRTRRLFSTLNRRAKPTSKGLNIAIDEDDAVAILSRRLVKENEVLSQLVSCSTGSKQLSNTKSNDSYITTLAAFYEVNEILMAVPLMERGQALDTDFKQFRPSEDDLENFYQFLESIWLQLLQCCPGFEAVLQGRQKPGDLRKETYGGGMILTDDAGKPVSGGSVFARPIGQFVIAEVLQNVGLQSKSIKDAIPAVMENISMDINSPPWVGIIWNPTTRKIIGGKPERKLLSAIITYALGLKVSEKVRELKQKYRDYSGDSSLSLLPSISWTGNIKAMEEEYLLIDGLKIEDEL